MPKAASITPQRVQWAGERQWKVELPARVTPNGKRQRFFFETRQAATSFCEAERIRLSNHGTEGMSSLSVSELTQAAMAFKLLEPHGVALNEVVSDWISRRQEAQASIPFEKAMDAFMEWGRRSPSYTRSIRQTRNRLATLHGRQLNTITPADLTLAMDAMPESVRNFTIRILGGLFNFGMKRGHCADNPCKKLDISRREAVEIEIHTPAEVAAILSAAETSDPELVPFLAFSFFCGIRLAEVLRLDWSAVDLHENFVKLPASITKTRQSRHIEISENCNAWLTPHTTNTGSVVPCSPDVLRKRMAALKSAHQIRTIKHGARHCFASYWLAKHGDINQLCRFMGHDDPETTFKHYAKAATKREAEKFWALLPSVSVAKNMVTFRKAIA